MRIQLLILAKKILSRAARLFPFIRPDSVMLSFLKAEFSCIAQEYCKKKAEASFKKADRIWVFWYQGYESAPPLVKKCIGSIFRHAAGHEVVLLTKENYAQYVQIPPYIMEKLEKGCFSLTHFSDLLRMELLSTHGGLWLDATVFVSQDIPDEFFTARYFTVHYTKSTSTITGGKWTGFCQSGCADSAVHSFCRDVFRAYWKKYDILADYFLIDYVTAFGCKNVPEIAALIDAVPLNNEGIKELDRHFNDEYSEAHLQSILASSAFFKLNWKRNYKTETNGRETVYGYFMRQDESQQPNTART